MYVRATGILIEKNKILLIQQKVNSFRSWSLPGGKLEEGESLKNCLIREMQEETGLDISVKRLLYICDRTLNQKHILHITFEVHRVGGVIAHPGDCKDSTPIKSIDMIDIAELEDYGFSKIFIKLIQNDFPNAGNYMGNIENIGL